MSNQVDYEINKELGECYLFMGEYDKAQDYYLKAVSCDKSKPEPYLGLAAIELDRGNLEQAYTLYTKANTVCQSDKTLSGMAMVEVEKGEYETAFTHYAQALSFNCCNMVAINGIVQLCYFLNRLDEAVPMLEAALEERSDEAIRYALAGCLLSIGREEESRAQLELLLGEHPENIAAQQLYAHFAA